MKKRIICLLASLVTAFALCGNALAASGNWGLGFPNPGQTPVGNEKIDYLRGYDAYFVDNSGEKTIYLTFDAGYENGYTETILDTLRENAVPATFFLVGTYIKDYPEIVKRMVAEGHTVGNHTMRHPDMSQITDPAAFAKELSQVEDLYRQVTGGEMQKLYRPPQGKYSEANFRLAKDLGYKTMFWSLAYSDYDNSNQPSKEMAFSKLIPRIHPGAIVLLHSTSQTNARILDELIDRYKGMGYTFKSLDSLS